jgi:hypothetical protein
MTTPEVQRLAGEAWAFRASVEQDAALRFQRLAKVLADYDPGSSVVALLRWFFPAWSGLGLTLPLPTDGSKKPSAPAAEHPPGA